MRQIKFRAGLGFGRARQCVAIGGLMLAFFSDGALRAADAPDAHTIPSIDGGIGSCSIEFTVKDSAAAPVYDAKVRVHIAYGFMRTHKLDLEVGTNSDGKARVFGLPEKVKQPLHFTATQADRSGDWDYDPAQNCTATHVIAISK